MRETGMSEAISNSGQSGGGVSPPSDMPAFNGALMQAYAQAGQAFMNSATAFGQEFARFAGERLEANVRMWQAWPNVTNWEAAASMQTDFVRTAADAYMAEMPKLTEQAARACAAIWQPVLEQAGDLPDAAAKTDS